MQDIPHPWSLFSFHLLLFVPYFETGQLKYENMTKIAILHESSEKGETAFRAIAGGHQSSGKTAGAALDALTAQLPKEQSSTLIIVQQQKPDRFFTEEQTRRLTQLMAKWRAARDRGGSLAPTEQTELEDLVEAEVEAAGKRAAAVADELRQ